MATFPHNLCGIRQDGHAEQHAPVVLRSEVERGTPRQRRTSADALVSVPCTLVFRSAAAAAEFEAWYYAEGSGWFDFTLPRTGAVVQARIVGGDIGGLTPITPAWNASERTLTLEYIRPGFVTLAPGLHTVSAARILSAQRNSTATYIDDAGVLQTAAANVVRYQGGQVLVEGEATNLLTYSQDFSNGDWVKTAASIAVDATASPVAASCFKLVESATSAAHSVQRAAVTPVVGDRRVAFVIAKAAERTRLLVSGIAGNSFYANFDLAGGTFGATGAGVTAGVVPLADGWKLCWLSKALTTTVSGAPMYLALMQADGTGTTYTGDGSSGVLLACAQFVDGLELSSYIPTTTAPASRAADLITVAA